MNILIYTPRAFTIGETFIQNQFSYQKKHKVFGICHKKQDNGIVVNNEIFKISAIPINFLDRILSYVHRKINKNTYLFSFYTEKRILKIINNNKIDVIHCNYGTNGLKFMNIIKKTKKPFVVHFHGIDASMHLEERSYIKKLPELFSIAHKVITVSEDMKERLIPFVNKEDLCKMEVIPYGVDFKKIISYTTEKIKTDTINIVHLGRITPKKGVLDLVKVFNSILKETSVKLHLNIIGTGSEFDELKLFVADNKLTGCITLHGALLHEKALKQLRNADVFVLNSRVAPNGDREGFPNVIIEAMAAELPIVSTYHAGIPMAITNEQEGLLVEEKNNVELGKALLRLIENKEERLLFAKKAKEKAMKNFSIEKAIEKYNKIYESI